MTVTIPPELEKEVQQAAENQRISVDAYVLEALKGHLRLDAALRDELDAWQEVRDEALRLVEDRCQ